MNKPAQIQPPHFQLFVWPQRMLVLGPAFDSQLHSHHAAQLAIGLNGNLRLRSAAHEWIEASAFFVPPDMPHEFDGHTSRCALLYLYPEGQECRHLCSRYGADTLRSVAFTAQLIEKLNDLAATTEGTALADQLCIVLLGMPPNSAQHTAHEPRFEAALQWIQANLEKPVRLAALASAIGVSESWLSHHFKQYKGVPLRRYVLWCRLRCAMEQAMRGASLTHAALHAGFADSAHFTRTFRNAYGICPSFLFGKEDMYRVSFATP